MAAWLMIGATGLVGTLALPGLLDAATRRGDLVLALGRRAPAMAHPALRTRLIDPVASALDAAAIGADDHDISRFICCLGTTLHAAGSRDAFAAVDRDLVLRIAALAREGGASHALHVSSVGADPGSRNFYLRIKGQTERGLAGLGFGRCDLLRPGLLIGARGKSRPAEAIAQRLAPVTDRLLHGHWRRYRSIDAGSVAAALVALSACDAPGLHVHEHDALQAAAQQAPGEADGGSYQRGSASDRRARVGRMR
jgi:uncharacterized protein YbjT (DUF2867 family)